MGIPEHQHAAPVDALVAEKTAQALKLRTRGWSYRRIAAELGIGKSMAHRYVVDALDELRTENAESAAHLRELELQRLDERDSMLWDGEKELTPEINNALHKNSERRARLVGLDAPVDGRIGGLPGAPPITTSGDLDLSKLDGEDLRALETLYAKAALPST